MKTKSFFIILFLISVMFLSGCAYSLNIFILPDDSEFLALVEKLNTPRKVCQYMLDNFETEEHPYITLTPYQLYIIKKGDCDDFLNFATFMVNYHGYRTYQLFLLFPAPLYPVDTWHAIAIYKEDNYYTFSENQYYNPSTKYYNSFIEIALEFNGWISYIVYDYDNNLIEQGIDN